MLGSAPQTERLMILLSHPADQYRVLVCGSDGNCQLSVGNGLLGCTWRLGKHGKCGPLRLTLIYWRLVPLLSIQFHKSKDLPNVLKMPAIYSAAMGEIEQAHGPSGVRCNGHDHETHFMLMCSLRSSVNCVSSSPGVRRRHWTQTYSLDKLFHSSCLCSALGGGVTGRTRMTSKRGIFRWPSQTIGSSWRCLKVRCLAGLNFSFANPIFPAFFTKQAFPKTINFEMIFQ